MKGEYKMDNKYSLEVLRKALDELEEDDLGLKMSREELGDYYVDKELKQNEEKRFDLEFHIDFIS